MSEFKKLGTGAVIFDKSQIIKKEVIEIGDYAKIDDYTFIYGGQGIKIGKHVHIASFVSIIGGGTLILEDYVAIACGARLITGTNLPEGGYHMSAAAPRDQQNVKISVIKVERDGFIGTNVIVHPGVTIGQGAVIGSNSLVLKDVEPWTINVGSPCKKIGMREKVRDEFL